MRAYNRKPKNAAELVAERHLIRAEAFEDAVRAVHFAMKTGRTVEDALAELALFARVNRDEAAFYAPNYRD